MIKLAEVTGAESSTDSGRQPSTLADAVDRLMEILAEEQLEQIVDLGDTELEVLHVSLGPYIRNNFGLWGENPALLADCGTQHADDAYVVILDALVKKLREER